VGNHAALTIGNHSQFYSNWYIPFQYLIPFEPSDFNGRYKFKTTVKKALEKFLSYGITVKTLEKKIAEIIHVKESQLKKYRVSGVDELYHDGEESDSIEMRLEMFKEDHLQVAETFQIVQELEKANKNAKVILDINEIKDSYEEGEWYSDMSELFTDSENDYRESLNTINLLDDFKGYDYFICHDSHDKKHFVEPLAKALKRKKMKVWYDKFVLRAGDSLTEKIDEGLKKSRYGIIVLSKNFVQNTTWARDEFISLKTRERLTGKRMIVPIWRKDVTHRIVADYNLELADRFALLEKNRLKSIVNDLEIKLKA
jgi:hypothetical protein